MDLWISSIVLPQKSTMQTSAIWNRVLLGENIIGCCLLVTGSHRSRCVKYDDWLFLGKIWKDTSCIDRSAPNLAVISRDVYIVSWSLRPDRWWSFVCFQTLPCAEEEKNSLTSCPFSLCWCSALRQSTLDGEAGIWETKKNIKWCA